MANSTRSCPGPELICRVVLFIVAACGASSAAEPEGTNSGDARWNLISIVTDDQARWAVGAYGNREARTPAMDRIAREGALFSNAFVNTPVCSPSRASFLTGLHGTRLGITDYISAEEGRSGFGLPPETLTWPEVLQQSGYSTALVGKWHLGSQPQFHPTRHGISHFHGFLGGGTKPGNPTLEVGGKTTKMEGAVADLLGDEALRFLDQSSSRPFALLLHFREPHMPYRPMPEEDTRLLQDLDPTVPDPKGADPDQLKRWTRDYYTAIHAADRNIGRILEKLDAAGLTSRTIVLFTSDHGYMIGHHSIHTKGNGWWVAGGVSGPKRPNMFEESIRVPMLVRWPGTVAPGTVVETPVTNVDVFSTVLAMLNVPQPAGHRQDGRSLVPALKGERIKEGYPVFGQYDLHNGGLAYMRMIRTNEWKLIRHYRAKGLDELYDLRNDPGETKNLFGTRAARPIQADLQRRLTEWQKSINDPLLAHLSEHDLRIADERPAEAGEE